MNKLYFRAWHKPTKTMIYPHQLNFIMGGEYHSYEAIDFEGNRYYWVDIEIDLMLGVEINDQIIYECDIIKIKGDYIDEAIVKADDFGFFLIDVVEPRFGKDYPMEDLQYADVKILGNIYENEELL